MKTTIKKLFASVCAASFITAAFIPCVVYAAQSVGQDGTVTYIIDTDTQTITFGGSGTITAELVNDIQCNRYDITHLVVMDGIEEIGVDAFYRMSYIETAELAESVKTIGDAAFFRSGLESISMPGAVRIGDDAFYSTNIEETESPLPESLEYIGDSAFSGTRYNEFEIPASVKYIGHHALNSKNVGYITVDENNENYSAVDNVLFSKDKTELIYYPVNCRMKEYSREDRRNGIPYEPDIYEIPSTVKKLADRAFYGKTYLGGVILDAALENLGAASFEASLTSIDASANNNFVMDGGILYDAAKTKIYVGLASQCGEQLVLPDTVQYVLTLAFADNDIIKEVKLNSGIKTVGRMAFGNCENLEKVTLYPNTYLDNGAFSEDYSISNVYFEGTAGQWEEIKNSAEDRNNTLFDAPVTFAKTDDDTDTAPEIKEFEKLYGSDWALSFSTGALERDSVVTAVMRDSETKDILGVKTAELKAGASDIKFVFENTHEFDGNAEAAIYCWDSLQSMTPLWSEPARCSSSSAN